MACLAKEEKTANLGSNDLVSATSVYSIIESDWDVE
jgi:hypothetical protein